MLIAKALESPLLGPIDLSLQAGECVSVEGASGSGKSLLLRALADIDPCEGAVSLQGQDWRSMSAPQWRRSVALVPAETGWWYDDVGSHFSDPTDPELLKSLEFLGLEPDSLDWEVDRLSTGERHRLGILRALANRPKVLLLDEPTAALDPDTTLKVENLVCKHVDTGGGAIVVSHDPSQPDRLGARRLRMSDRRLEPVDGPDT